MPPETHIQKINPVVRGWLLLMAALLIHVIDETVTDFLPLYNRTVLNLRESLGFFPAPTFSFSVWLGGLLLLITIGFAGTPLVKRGSKAIRVFVILLSFAMILNGLNHIFWSIYFGRLMPGFWSSPLLIVVSLYLFVHSLRRSIR